MIDQGEQQSKLARKLSAWRERADQASAQDQQELLKAVNAIIGQYEKIIASGEPENEILVKANQVRKQLEAAEQHRTMSAEHGLIDEAIDVTAEINALEQQLITLIDKTS